jgi:hypothetical protein
MLPRSSSLDPFLERDHKRRGFAPLLFGNPVAAPIVSTNDARSGALGESEQDLGLTGSVVCGDATSVRQVLTPNRVSDETGILDHD